MSMTHEQDVLKSEKLMQQFAEMQDFVRLAARDGQAIHEVERIGVGVVYLLFAGRILWRQRVAIPGLFRDGFRTPVAELVHAGEDAVVLEPRQ